MTRKNRTAIKQQQAIMSASPTLVLFVPFSHFFLPIMFLCFCVRASVDVCACLEQNNIYIYVYIHMNAASLLFHSFVFIRTLAPAFSPLSLISRFLQCQRSPTVHTQVCLDARVIEHAYARTQQWRSSLFNFHVFFPSFSHSIPSVFFLCILLTSLLEQFDRHICTCKEMKRKNGQAIEEIYQRNADRHKKKIYTRTY